MQILTLTFPFRIPPYELTDFRRAVNHCVDRKAEHFHNHNNSDGPSPYHWDYPRIRYSLYCGRATVTGIGEGAMTLTRHLLPRLLSGEPLLINGRPYSVSGFQCEQRDIPLELLPTRQPFYLHRWVALNKDNYRQWKKLEGKENARQILLGRALTGQLRTLAESLAPEIDREEIVAEILSVDQQKRIKWHRTQLIGFNVIAQSRLLPPVGLGVGRSVSFGFGEVVPPQIYRRFLNRQSPHTRIPSTVNRNP